MSKSFKFKNNIYLSPSCFTLVKTSTAIDLTLEPNQTGFIRPILPSNDGYKKGYRPIGVYFDRTEGEIVFLSNPIIYNGDPRVRMTNISTKKSQTKGTLYTYWIRF